MLFASDRRKPVLLLYENMCGVLHARKDADGQVQPPPVDIVRSDLEERGYMVQWRRLDSQDYLLGPI